MARKRYSDEDVLKLLREINVLFEKKFLRSENKSAAQNPHMILR